VIRRLIERDCVGACVGPVWDPVAVAFCHAAGMGTTFSLRFGGKAAATSGDPIDAEVTVIGLCRNGQQSFGSAKKSFGDAAGIRVGGVEVSLIAARTQALGTEIFSEVGIDIASKCHIEVDEPLLRRLQAHRRQGSLLRRQRALAGRPARVPIPQDHPPPLATR
jgi:microcystin degradation protein MlrC